MGLSEKIEDCYDLNRQLWVVSESPMDIPLQYGLYRKEYAVGKVSSKRNMHRQIYEHTIPDWLIEPWGTWVDYSEVPKHRRQEVPTLLYKKGKEYVKFGDVELSGTPLTMLDLLAERSKERKEMTATVPKEFMAELKELYESDRLPDPDYWVEKTHELWDRRMSTLTTLPAEGRKKVFFADPLDRLDSIMTEFILKYWGDPRMTRNMFMVVGAPRMPARLYKEWELYLLEEHSNSW